MRDRRGVAALVVGLVVVCVAALLWVRGDLPGGGGQRRSAKPHPTTPSRTTALPVAEFRLATFNALGSSHTAPGGNMERRASGPERTRGLVALLAEHHVSVVGLQEFQLPQRAAFARLAPGWSMYPGLADRRAGVNSVAWRNDVWERVDQGQLVIPYFHGRPTPEPYVMLRHRATGVVAYFSTFHNPADTHGPAHRYRLVATRREIELFRRLEATGRPQFVTGDMNAQAEYFCMVTAATSLHAAQGGRNGGGCRLPAERKIDWIFGSSHVQFRDFDIDDSALVRRTSDHTFVSATARVDAADFENAYQPRG